MKVTNVERTTAVKATVELDAEEIVVLHALVGSISPVWLRRERLPEKAHSRVYKALETLAYELDPTHAGTREVLGLTSR